MRSVGKNTWRNTVMPAFPTSLCRGGDGGFRQSALIDCFGSYPSKSGCEASTEDMGLECTIYDIGSRLKRCYAGIAAAAMSIGGCTCSRPTWDMPNHPGRIGI